MKRMREIIKIDEDKCDGCGACVPGCAEGALAIVDGKARLVSEVYCDGLGACVGHCPQGALTVVREEAQPFDGDAVNALRAEQGLAPIPLGPDGLPLPHDEPHDESHDASHAAKTAAKPLSPCQLANRPVRSVEGDGPLGHWPVKLRLVPEDAPYLKGAKILLAADCAAVAAQNFQETYVKDHVVLLACPKFEENQERVQKLAAILAANSPASLTVLRMEVPCCGGLTAVANAALKTSGSATPAEVLTIGRDGSVVRREELGAPALAAL